MMSYELRASSYDASPDHLVLDRLRSSLIVFSLSACPPARLPIRPPACPPARPVPLRPIT